MASGVAALGVVEAWEVRADTSVPVQAAQVGAAIVAGVLVFLVSALILRIGEVDDLRKAIVRRFRG
jgi:hypothetical protein